MQFMDAAGTQLYDYKIRTLTCQDNVIFWREVIVVVKLVFTFHYHNVLYRCSHVSAVNIHLCDNEIIAEVVAADYSCSR